MVLSLLRRATDYVRYCYFHYTLLTTLAFLEPAERRTVNVIFTVILATLLYTTAVYLPGHLSMVYYFLMHVLGVESSSSSSSSSSSAHADSVEGADSGGGLG